MGSQKMCVYWNLSSTCCTLGGLWGIAHRKIWRRPFKVWGEALITRRDICELEATLAAERGIGDGRHLERIWFVRAGLASPTVAANTLRNVFFEFPAEERAAIGTTTIREAKDAMAEIDGIQSRSIGRLAAPHEHEFRGSLPARDSHCRARA